MKKNLFLLTIISLFLASEMRSSRSEYTNKKILSLVAFGVTSVWLIKEAYDYYVLKKKIKKIIGQERNRERMKEIVKDDFYLFILYQDYLMKEEYAKNQVPRFFYKKDFMMKNQAYSKKFLEIKSKVYKLLYRIIDILNEDHDFRELIALHQKKIFFKKSIEHIIFTILLEKDFFTGYLLKK